jgi:hypothetical protein
MRQVKAKPGARKLGEVSAEVVGGLTTGFARVHVLERKSPPEPSVKAQVGDRVGVDDDRVDPRRDPAKVMNEPLFVVVAVL